MRCCASAAWLIDVWAWCGLSRHTGARTRRSSSLPRQLGLPDLLDFLRDHAGRDCVGFGARVGVAGVDLPGVGVGVFGGGDREKIQKGHAVRLNFLAEFFVQGRVGVIRAEVRIALKDGKHDEQDWDVSFLCIAGERFEGAPCLLPMSELIGVQIEVVHIGQVEEFSLERGRAGIQR